MLGSIISTMYIIELSLFSKSTPPPPKKKHEFCYFVEICAKNAPTQGWNLEIPLQAENQSCLASTLGLKDNVCLTHDQDLLNQDVENINIIFIIFYYHLGSSWSVSRWEMSIKIMSNIYLQTIINQLAPSYRLRQLFHLCVSINQLVSQIAACKSGSKQDCCLDEINRCWSGCIIGPSIWYEMRFKQCTNIMHIKS